MLRVGSMGGERGGMLRVESMGGEGGHGGGYGGWGNCSVLGEIGGANLATGEKSLPIAQTPC